MRVVHGAIVIFVASSLAFLLLQIAPGDPYSHLFDAPGMTPELRASMLERYGRDQPMHVQYVRWLAAAARGDFGWSTLQDQPVSAVIARVLPRTVVLMSVALGASLVLGVVIGQWQALRAGSRGDRAVGAVSFVLYSMPEFWLAMLLLLLFAGWLRVLPASGIVGDLHEHLTPAGRAVDYLRHFILPWTSLTLVGTAIFARFHRAAMRDVLTQPFVQNAHARGLPASLVRRHARRAALTPVVTVAGVLLPALVGGAVFVEQVFSWNGMGATLLAGINKRDYALVSAIVVIGSAMTVLGGLLADVVRELVDPRTPAR